MAPYNGLGFWVWEAEQVDAERFCSRLVQNHYSWVVVKAHDGGHGFNTAAAIQRWKDACQRRGLRFGVWGYCTGDAAADANMAQQAVKRFGAQFYVADIEVEYERASGPVSRSFCEHFRAALPHLPACISSFGRIDFHSAIDFKSWRDHGFDFMPQAYECESSALTPDACIHAAEAVWGRDRIYPTLGSYAGVHGILSGQHLYDSVARRGLPGVNIWDAQELHGDQLEKVGLLAHPSAPPPKPTPRPPGHGAPIFPEGVPRALRLTSPLMRGPDIENVQKGILFWTHDHGGPTIAVDGIYGPATAHALSVTAFSEGLIDTSGSKDTIDKILRPWRRSGREIARGKQRRDAQAHQQQQHGSGLAALPGIAAHYIGIHEDPSGSNWGYPHPADWEEACGFAHGPWCAAFASVVIRLGGGHVSIGYVPTIVSDAKNGTGGFEAWTDHHASAGPGWCACYDWNGDGVADHIGVVESIAADHLVAIEGNTSGRSPSYGGMVDRVTRGYGPVMGYAKPRL